MKPYISANAFRPVVLLLFALLWFGGRTSAHTVMHDNNFVSFDGTKEIKEQWQAVGNVTKGGTVLDTTRSDGAPGLFYLTKKVGDISNREVAITGVGTIQKAGAGGGIDIGRNVGVIYVVGTVQSATKSSLTIQWKVATEVKTLVVSITDNSIIGRGQSTGGGDLLKPGDQITAEVRTASLPAKVLVKAFVGPRTITLRPFAQLSMVFLGKEFNEGN